MSKGERARQNCFFATARYVSTEWIAGQLVSVPRSVVHAKAMGSLHTLCGELAVTWPKMWDQPFAAVQGECCRECAVEASGALARSEATPR